MGLVRLRLLASIAAMGKPTQRALKVLEGGEFYLAIRAEEEEFSCWEFMDPAFYVHEVTGRVVLSNFSGTPLVEVGTFCVKLVDAEGALCQGVSVHTTFDIQQETWSFFEELVEGPFPWKFKDRVLKALGCEFEVVPLGVTILSRLEIYPEYRGRDYGLAAVKCMMQRYRMGAGLIVMKPFPLQFEGLEPEFIKQRGFDVYPTNQRTCTQKLRAHYGRLGFKHIPRTQFMAVATITPWDDTPVDVVWPAAAKSANELIGQ
jgi:hypothetical protein